MRERDSKARVDYGKLADFRYHLRRFLHFSEGAAEQAGLEPQQHQLILALKGAAAGEEPTVGYVAERLQIHHNSAVELVNRLARKGLIRRQRTLADRRKVVLHLTSAGEQVIRRLSVAHVAELRTARVHLLQALHDLGRTSRNGEDGRAAIMSANADLSEQHPPALHLGDFTTTQRVIPIALCAICVGVLGAFVALGLLKLIGMFTNLFFFQRWGTALVSPAGNHLGYWVILVPVIGGLIVGLMAKYGSERIRGHGIPEAIECILINGSRVPPRLAFLKPLSSAIAIGSGGPFGAEGPIIMTGGAFGSMIAQFLNLTAAERKTLLVAGAAAGMSATFAAPVSAVLLAVEILLFEWKPRSLIPVALASATAGVVRHYLLGPGPLFITLPHPDFIGASGLAGCMLIGLAAGVLSALLTLAIYEAEDLFAHVRLHWMWWPALGGLVIGIGGLIFPPALGVGYDVIGSLLQHNPTAVMIAGILLVKSTIWAISLGSGTSGGVLAPLLMMGGALGALASNVLPNEGVGFWPLISMGAVLGGTMRAPLTGIVFSWELTHDPNILLPLLVACVLSHAFTVLTLRRSILTEKVSRRGYHLSCEYATDPLEILFVREVMRRNVTVLPANLTACDLERCLQTAHGAHHQRLFPVLDGNGTLQGVIRRRDIENFFRGKDSTDNRAELLSLVRADRVIAYPDETLREAVNRMASTGLTQFPVVDRKDSQKVVGLIMLEDLLRARERHLEEERRRERVLRIRLPRLRSKEVIPVETAQYRVENADSL